MQVEFLPPDDHARVERLMAEKYRVDRVLILPLYASQKLFPRLGELRASHPELHLDIDTAAHLVSRLGDGLDAVIALSREIDPAFYARRLDRNSVYVIGARTLLEDGTRVRLSERVFTLSRLIGGPA